MSRSNQKEIKENVCKKFLQWKTIKEVIIIDGDEVEKIKGGQFSYWDKEKEENIPVKLPFKFCLLNQDLVNFKGYDEKNKRAVWSNEVRDKDHVVHLRAKDEKLLEFKLSEYKLNKDKIKGLGGRYTKSLYLGVEVNGTWEVWNIQGAGSFLTGSVDFENPQADEKEDGWFNFTKVNKSKLFTNFIEVNGYKPKKKGTSKYVIPTFSIGDVISDEDSVTLNELDKSLNEYLDYYFDRPAEVPVEKEEHADATDY